MPLFWNFGVGPVRYVKRVGGGKQRTDWNKVLERQEARLRAQGVDVEKRRKINAVIFSVILVLLFVILVLSML